jgi:hypothetical protein
MPNYGYRLARAEGNRIRQLYRALLPKIVRRPVDPPRSVPLRVFTYSDEKSLPEQVASIRSFLRHVGRPESFTVVSDGSHSEKSVRLLELVDPVVSVRPSGQQLPENLPARFRHYVTTYPMGKQLGLLVSLPANAPALYLDSDVLFFRGAADLLRYSSARDISAFYLEDCKTSSADARLFHEPGEKLRPVNCGALLFFKNLDWSLGIRRFLELEGEPNFFTNQTIAHLVLHANDARSFDRSKYVVQLDDQFVFRDRYAGDKLALRHYVNPVRHKFWTTLWRT